MKTIYLAIFLLISPLAFAESVLVSFTHPEPETVTGFEIRWMSSTGESGFEQLPPDQMSWEHTNLETGQSITYEAYAFNAGGYSTPTPQVTAVINPEVETPDNTIEVPVYVTPIRPSKPIIIEIIVKHL